MCNCNSNLPNSVKRFNVLVKIVCLVDILSSDKITQK